MRLHPLAPALALAAALGGSVLWIALRGSAGQPPSPAVAAAADAVPAAPAAEAATVTAPERAEENADADAAADDAARSEVETTTTADSPVGPLVHVLLGREPAAGAKVAWIDLEDGQRRREREVRDRRIADDDVPDLDLPFRYGSRGAADDHGTLRLPPLRAPTVVAAQDDAGRFAAAIVQPDRPRVLLRLRDDETLRLCVRDAMRTPQGDVALAVWAGKKFGEAGSLWQGRTHQDGTATVRHFQQARDGAQGERFAAAVAVPLRTPVAVEFQGRPAPKEPIELVLPRTSPVEFAVVHQSGAPILAEISVSLLPVRDEKFALPLPLAPRFDTARATKANGEPAAWLPHVDLGVELLPVLRLLGERRPVLLPVVTLPDVTPPEGGNPPAKLRAVLPPEFTVLVGTALLADGGPLASASVDWALSPTRGAPLTGSLATLADGRFDFVLRNRDPAQTWTLVLRCTDGNGAVLTADLKPQALPPGDRRGLGAITLRPAPLLANGRVHDDRGEPVANASVALQVLAPGKRGDEWQDAALLRTSSAQDGTFELVGNAPEHALRLSVQAAGHLPWNSPPLRPGAEFEVTLVRQGILIGTVRLPDWLPPNAAVLQLTTAYEPRREASVTLPQKGPFRLGGLVPDTYDARLTIRNLPHPLQVLAAVRIEPGENRDPQLEPLDLAASLFRYRLRAVGPGGRPLADFDGPIVWKTTSPRGESATVGFRWQKGRAELITGASFLEFTTVGQGYLPAKVSVPAGDNDVYLQPVQPVIVDLPGLRALCGPDRAIRVSLIRQGDTGLPEGLGGVDQRTGQGFSYPRWYLGRSGGGWLSPNDRAEAIVSMNGTHDVVLRIYADQRRDGPQDSLPLGKLDAVVDDQAPQVHRVSFDAARVTAALQHLDQQLRDAAAQGSR